MSETGLIARIVLDCCPAVQAIYLYGTYGTGLERPDSDVDIALLLAPQEARAVKGLALSDLRFALEAALGRDVDLVNARRVSTVLQKEIVAVTAGCGDSQRPAGLRAGHRSGQSRHQNP